MAEFLLCFKDTGKVQNRQVTNREVFILFLFLFLLFLSHTLLHNNPVLIVVTTVYFT